MLSSICYKINKGYTYGESNTPIKTRSLFVLVSIIVIIILYFYIIQHKDIITFKLKERKYYLNYKPELKILCSTG